MSALSEVRSSIPPVWSMTIEERAKHVFLAETDPDYRALFLRLIDDPKHGDAFFINTCCWTYDPRRAANGKPIGAVPFLLWQAQALAGRRIGHAIDNEHDLGEEKSRDQGLTWINLALILKRFLRVRGFSALIGSMTEDLLDSAKNPATLGWKLDFLYSHLPPFLKSRTYDPENQLCRSFAAWRNDEMQSVINGKAPTARFAVGDRRSVIYFDDWAQWEHGAAAWEAAAATTNSRLASWTVNPEDPMNHAFELRFGRGRFQGVKTPLIPVEELHWTSDPRRQETAIDPATKEVYNVWKRGIVGDPARGIPGKISLTQFRRDYEGVYEIAAKGRIYAEQLPNTQIGSFPYDARFPLYTFWDYGVSDDCVVIWAQWDFERNRLRLVDSLIRSGHGMGYYVPFVTGRKSQAEILEHEEEYDDLDRAIIARHTGWQRFNRAANALRVRYQAHYGDPAGKQRSLSHNKSARDVLLDADIVVTCRDDNAGKGYKGRIESLRRLLPYIDIDEEYCPGVIAALQNYKWNEAGTAPEHDEYSHPCAALEYGAVNLTDELLGLIRAQAEAKARPGRSGGVFGNLNDAFDVDDRDDRRTATGRRDPTGY